MLTKWKLSNFKAIRQETELEFKPLTIFAGANSSGKSTVLQSILLVAQSLANEVTNRPIVLNGDLVRLGQFNDLRSNDSENRSIGLGWIIRPISTVSQPTALAASDPVTRYTLDAQSPVREVYTEIAFDSESGSDSPEVLQLQPSLTNLELRTSIQSVESEFRTATMQIIQKNLVGPTESEDSARSLVDDPNSERTQFSIKFDPETEEDRSSQALDHTVDGAILRNFLPSSVAAFFDPRVVFTEALVRALLGEPRSPVLRSGFSQMVDEPVPRPLLGVIANHLVGGNRVTERLEALFRGDEPVTIRRIEQITRLQRRLGHLKAEAIEDAERLRSVLLEYFSSIGLPIKVRRQLPLPDEMRSACQSLRRWFVSMVKYLGPLRDEPKALYPLVSNLDPRDVGLRGEHTAAVFHVNRGILVEYLPASNFANPRVSSERKVRSLGSAVSDWLVYLGVAAEVLTRDMGKLGHEMQVRLFEEDPPHDLTHVGVGVSQVLPIVVSCLLAEPDTLLIFEQPELHLHPKVQTLLADFFLAMAMLGKQCVLETHSEYLINRLRFRAAAAEGSQLVETIQIYFAEKKGSESSFRPIVVNQYGAILDWPEGFFDQSQDEAERILRAATNKRKRIQRPAEDV